MADDSAAAAASATAEEVPAAEAPAADAAGAGGSGGGGGDSGADASIDAAAAAASIGGKKRKKWVPLESNPELWTPHCRRLGLPDHLQWTDVMSTEEWAMEMVPQPVLALIFLFPIKDSTEKHRDEEAAKIEKDGQTVSPNIYYTKQIVGNACGTIALLHSIANVSTYSGGGVSLTEGKFFDKFLSRTLDMNPDERAEALEEDDSVEEEHSTMAAGGQSAVEMDVMTHFVALVPKDGCLYELDGRKKFPINHGPTTSESFFTDAVEVVKGFMARDPGELRFTMGALTPAMD